MGNTMTIKEQLSGKSPLMSDELLDWVDNLLEKTRENPDYMPEESPPINGAFEVNEEALLRSVKRDLLREELASPLSNVGLSTY